MTWTAYNLRFTDEDQAITVLARFRAEGAWITASHVHALDPIGPLVLEQAVTDEDTGEVVVPAVADARYHVNLLLAEPDPGLAGFETHPVTPRRGWLP